MLAYQLSIQPLANKLVSYILWQSFSVSGLTATVKNNVNIIMSNSLPWWSLTSNKQIHFIYIYTHLYVKCKSRRENREKQKQKRSTARVFKEIRAMGTLNILSGGFWSEKLSSVISGVINSSSFNCLKGEKLFVFASSVLKRKKEKKVPPTWKVILSTWYNYFKMR